MGLINFILIFKVNLNKLNKRITELIEEKNYSKNIIHIVSFEKIWQILVSILRDTSGMTR